MPYSRAAVFSDLISGTLCDIGREPRELRQRVGLGECGSTPTTLTFLEPRSPNRADVFVLVAGHQFALEPIAADLNVTARPRPEAADAWRRTVDAPQMCEIAYYALRCGAGNCGSCGARRRFLASYSSAVRGLLSSAFPPGSRDISSRTRLLHSATIWMRISHPDRRAPLLADIVFGGRAVCCLSGRTKPKQHCDSSRQLGRRSAGLAGNWRSCGCRVECQVRAKLLEPFGKASLSKGGNTAEIGQAIRLQWVASPVPRPQAQLGCP